MSLCFDLGYATRGINYAEKSFMKLTPMANFIELFCCNLPCYCHIALSFDSGYATKGIKYAEKSFVKLTPMANFIELFFSVIYNAIALLP